MTLKIERDYSFDVIKGICIYLMVLGHCGSPCHKFIYLFHMAVFFIVADYFFKEKCYNSFENVKEYVLKKIKSLYISFITLNGIATILHNFFIHINVMTNNPNFSSVYSGVTYNSVDTYSLTQILSKLSLSLLFYHGEQIGGATWFLRVLFFISILSCLGHYLLKKVIKSQVVLNRVIFVVYLMTMILGYVLYKVNFNFYSIGTMFSCSILFYLGILYKKYEQNIQIGLISLVLSLLALFIIWSIIPYSIAIVSNKYVNPIYLLSASISGFIFVKSISKYILNSKILTKMLSYIGAHSISILLLHFLSFKIITLLQVIMYKHPLYDIAAFPVLYTNNLWWFIYSIIGITVPLGIYYLYNFVKQQFRSIGI